MRSWFTKQASNLRDQIRLVTKAILRPFHATKHGILGLPARLERRAVKAVHAWTKAWNSAWGKRVRHMTWATSLIVFIISVVLAGLFSFYSLSFSERVLVKVRVPGADLSGLTQDEALNLLKTNFSQLEAAGIPFRVGNKQYTVPIEALGIEYDLEETARRAFALGHSGKFWPDQYARLKAIFMTQQVIDPAEIVHRDKVEDGVRKHISPIAVRAQDAYIVVRNNEFVAVPSAKGKTTDFDRVTAEVIRALEYFEPAVIHITVRDQSPVITDEEAERAIAVAEDMAKGTMQLAYGDIGSQREWILNIARDKGWIAFKQDGPLLKPVLNATKLRDYLADQVVPTINRERIDATIIMPEDGGRFAKLEGRAQDGYTLLIEDTVQAALESFDQGKDSTTLAVAYEPGRILTPEGEDVGLHDLISVGRSNFANSPANRSANIEFGLSKYNGLIIFPDEEFSFNEWLGPVTYAAGWKPALAIFDGGASTEMAPGGGLCQVSTTMYRAALYAGLPILAQKNHSFYVSYYAAYADGLDATVYMPNPDLKFKNNTGAPILIQAYADGTDAIIKFYGTSDGRKVTMDGPYKSGWTGAGPARVVESTEIAPGTQVQEMAAHPGRRITWYQTIEYANGETVKHTLTSNYRAIPALIKKGVTTLTQALPEADSQEVIL